MEEIKNVKLKTLATCKPTEFAAQTVKISKALTKWLEVTDAAKIRQTMEIKPTPVPEKATKEEKARIEKENQEQAIAQGKKNAGKIFNATLVEHPKETLDLLALFCFVDPEKMDDYPMGAYLEAFADLVASEQVWRFFFSVVRLVRTFGLTA